MTIWRIYRSNVVLRRNYSIWTFLSQYFALFSSSPNFKQQCSTPCYLLRYRIRTTFKSYIRHSHFHGLSSGGEGEDKICEKKNVMKLCMYRVRKGNCKILKKIVKVERATRKKFLHCDISMNELSPTELFIEWWYVSEWMLVSQGLCYWIMWQNFPRVHESVRLILGIYDWWNSRCYFLWSLLNCNKWSMISIIGLKHDIYYTVTECIKTVLDGGSRKSSGEIAVASSSNFYYITRLAFIGWLACRSRPFWLKSYG